MMNITMKNRILLGVYAIYCARKLKSSFVPESLLFVMLGVTLFYFVSVPSVLTNMSNSESSYRYFVMAFSHTGLLVQSILVLVAITALFFLRNIPVYTILKRNFT